ncbi:MAG: hypothetical protein PUE25_10530 [bacterium]|nr:hypothetical protein [bacterium]MDD6902239.1 hypothetical protein [bacterium]
MMKKYKILALGLLMSASMSAMAQDVKYATGKALTETTTEVTNNMNNLVQKTSRYHGAGIPYLGFFAGASHLNGEFVRLKTCFPGITGFNAFGGVGKEYIFNGEYSKDMTWHAGLGYYATDALLSGYEEDTKNILSIDIYAAKTAYYKDPVLAAQFEWDHFFGDAKRFGVFGAVGFGFGDLDADEPDLLWDVTVGVSIKIFK